MTLHLVLGRYYKDAKGRVVGPMSVDNGARCASHPFYVLNELGRWNEKGEAHPGVDFGNRENLVEALPVRETETFFDLAGRKLGLDDAPAVNTEGRKDDTGKDRFELLPPEPLFGIARVLAFGATKYEARNWEKGMAWGRVFGALMRHLWAWWGGAGPTTKSFVFGELDQETSFSHLWHAGCCLFFLIAYEERGAGTDDRLHKSVDTVSAK